ncbi:hypothetical protein MASR2M78_02970 [Treponema sp.]
MNETRQALFREMVASSFAKIEQQERNNTLKRIDALLSELSSLEDELNIILAAAGADHPISR